MAETNQGIGDIFNIVNLFRQIFDVYDPGEEDFRAAIGTIQASYRPSGFENRMPVDFNDRAIRCAYMHKYSAIHAAIIQKVLLEYLLEEDRNQIFPVESKEISICSLGGGPCSDVIGVLAGLMRLRPLSETIYRFTSIDISPGWETTHDDIMKFLQNSEDLGNFYRDRATSVFEIGDIRNPNEEIADIIRTSDVIIMFKFVSELNRHDVSGALENVFRLMKPKAAVLFVDNSGGGFLEIVDTKAIRHNLRNIIWKRNIRYENEAFHQERYGRVSLRGDGLAVAIGIWIKTDH